MAALDIVQFLIAVAPTLVAFYVGKHFGRIDERERRFKNDRS